MCTLGPFIYTFIGIVIYFIREEYFGRDDLGRDNLDRILFSVIWPLSLSVLVVVYGFCSLVKCIHFMLQRLKIIS